MASKAAKSKKAPEPRKPKYDQSKILKLWQDGKSIREISEAMKRLSRVFAHRVLTTKFPKEYEAGTKARKAACAKAAEVKK
jgi:hypothetical protein